MSPQFFEVLTGLSDHAKECIAQTVWQLHWPRPEVMPAGFIPEAHARARKEFDLACATEDAERLDQLGAPTHAEKIRRERRARRSSNRRQAGPKRVA
jgi:hypothetical protein